MNVEIDIDEAMNRIDAALASEGGLTSSERGLVRDALASFAPTPEPKGIGAVVESSSGSLYLRVPTFGCDDNPWLLGTFVTRSWDDIPKPVTVLSEGVGL